MYVNQKATLSTSLYSAERSSEKKSLWVYFFYFAAKPDLPSIHI